MTEADDMLATAVRDETAARAIEHHLPHLRHVRGVEMPRAADYGPDEQGRARYRADLAARRLAWLEARYRAAETARTWRDQAARTRAAGLGRFAPGDRPLDRDLQAVTATARQAARSRRQTAEHAEHVAAVQARVEARKAS